MRLAPRSLHFVLLSIAACSLSLLACQNPASSNAPGGSAGTTPGHAQWARTVTSGSDSSEFTAVAEDTAGDIYAAGFITGTSPYSFGNSVTVQGSSSGENPVLVKYNANGTPQWAVSDTGGASGDSKFEGVALGASGNVYAVGVLAGTSAYGFGNSISADGVSSQTTAVLVKYSPAGTAQWADAIGTATGSGSTAYSGYDAVAVDGSDNIDVSGGIADTFTYPIGAGGLTATGTALFNPIVVQYTSSGTPQWAKTITYGSNIAGFNALAVDGSGNIYAAGQITGPGSDYFGAGSTVGVAGTGSFNVLLVKYSATGSPLWGDSITAGGDNPNATLPEEADFTGVAVDGSGNVYAAGTIMNTDPFSFGASGSVSVAGPTSSWNLVLVKYNGSGAAQWAKSLTSAPASSDYVGVAVDPSDNLFAAGYDTGLGGTYDFGGGITSSAPGFPNLLVKYSSSGTPEWADAMDSDSEAQLLAVTADPSSTGPVFAAGWFASGSCNFGGGVTATGVQSENALLIKYAKQ